MTKTFSQKLSKIRKICAFINEFSVCYFGQTVSYRKIAELTGLSPQTASNQVHRYQEQGLAGLLTDKRGGSFRYYMTHDEEIHFLAEQFKKASRGDLLTIASLHEAY